MWPKSRPARQAKRAGVLPGVGAVRGDLRAVDDDVVDADGLGVEPPRRHRAGRIAVPDRPRADRCLRRTPRCRPARLRADAPWSRSPCRAAAGAPVEQVDGPLERQQLVLADRFLEKPVE